jgi:hypothetical protein
MSYISYIPYIFPVSWPRNHGWSCLCSDAATGGGTAYCVHDGSRHGNEAGYTCHGQRTNVKDLFANYVRQTGCDCQNLTCQDLNIQGNSINGSYHQNSLSPWAPGSLSPRLTQYITTPFGLQNPITISPSTQFDHIFAILVC